MGVLTDPTHPSCLKQHKSKLQWTSYVKGASALFACHITRSTKVTVLLPPPPEKLNPSGLSNYQLIEEPILQGIVGNHIVGKIGMVHSTVVGAEYFWYENWPIDRTVEGTDRFPNPAVTWPSWRALRSDSKLQQIMSIVGLTKEYVLCAGSIAVSTSVTVTKKSGHPETEQKEAVMVIVASKMTSNSMECNASPGNKNTTQGKARENAKAIDAMQNNQWRGNSRHGEETVVTDNVKPGRDNKDAKIDTRTGKSNSKLKNNLWPEQVTADKPKRKKESKEKEEKAKADKAKRKREKKENEEN
ncbi:hypothetical protein KVT40_002131 [Elsinoe batatas]|uniref:Uncharacterized protein n=1 Tax=Elsinoe batatas TaxID=2601811 RepID=A0A8K0PJG9_9PEZI|nr:hypothetical protein KVT40_002131 [Elsinoe batatas]